MTGVGGESVGQVEQGGLAMWVSPTTASGVSAKSLREHERVVRSALATATPLPLRFGARFRDESEVQARLLERADEFGSLLEELAGQVEMGVRVEPGRDGWEAPGEAAEDLTPSPPVAATPGRAHLEARRNTRLARSRGLESVEEAMARIRSETAALHLPTRASVVSADPPFGSVAHLVRREDIPAFRDRIADIASRHTDLRITVTGPWAPYSFLE